MKRKYITVDLMVGLELESFTNELEKVEPHFSEQPSKTIKDIEKKLESADLDCIKRYYGEEFSFEELCHRLPLEMFSQFSFDELCKLKYSAQFMMHQSVRDLFETDAEYELVRKIINSMWRWGMGKGIWNEVVDVHNCIRHFSFLDDPRFEIRLDHTTWFNRYGYSKYSRTYLDGVFAYLIHYKRKHVFTIGFSIMDDRRLLLQQIQSTKRKGNRYLYKLPVNRLEFVLNLFKKNFPEHDIYLVDGEDLANKTLSSYQRVLQNARKRHDQIRADLKRSSEECDSNEQWLLETKEEIRHLKAGIRHLKKDKTRLVKSYQESGKFEITSTVIDLNNLKHRLVIG